MGSIVYGGCNWDRRLFWHHTFVMCTTGAICVAPQSAGYLKPENLYPESFFLYVRFDYNSSNGMQRADVTGDLIQSSYVGEKPK
jgi:hypothetical protein